MFWTGRREGVTLLWEGELRKTRARAAPVSLYTLLEKLPDTHENNASSPAAGGTISSQGLGEIRSGH